MEGGRKAKRVEERRAISPHIRNNSAKGFDLLTKEFLIVVPVRDIDTAHGIVQTSQDGILLR